MSNPESGTDPLRDKLDELNKVLVPKKEDKLKPADTKATAKETKKEPKKEPEKEPKKEPEKKVEAKDWLIKDKFENNEDGIKSLIKSYTNIQGLSDTNARDLLELKQKVTPLLELDVLIDKHPKIAQALNNALEEIKQDEQGLKPPVMPDDFNAEETYTEGTSSFKYRLAENEYNINLAVSKATKPVEELKTALLANQKTADAQKDFEQKLIAGGLTKDEVKEYRKFFGDNSNNTIDNAIKAFRALTGEVESAQAKTTVEDLKNKDKTVAAASKSGKIDRVTDKPVEKLKKQTWENIMSVSKK